MKNWYIVQTFSGFEQKVADTLSQIRGGIDMLDKNDQSVTNKQ